MQQRLTAILLCNRLDRAQFFFERLGFSLEPGSQDEYRLLSDGVGGFIHLNRAVDGWPQPGRNPFGLHLYREDVDRLAAAFAGETLARPRDTAWSMYELALNGPDDTLVRVGWPTQPRSKISSSTGPKLLNVNNLMTVDIDVGVGLSAHGWDMARVE